MMTPTLTSFAPPQGGCARPWGGPAGGAMTPTLTSFAQSRRGACALPASFIAIADNRMVFPC